MKPVEGEDILDTGSLLDVALGTKGIFDGWSNVPDFNALKGPDFTLVNSLMCNNPWCQVEIEGCNLIQSCGRGRLLRRVWAGVRRI